MTDRTIYRIPGAVQARRIGREACASHNARRWRLAMLLMRNSMRIHAIAREASK